MTQARTRGESKPLWLFTHLESNQIQIKSAWPLGWPVLWVNLNFLTRLENRGLLGYLTFGCPAFQHLWDLQKDATHHLGTGWRTTCPNTSSSVTTPLATVILAKNCKHALSMENALPIGTNYSSLKTPPKSGDLHVLVWIQKVAIINPLIKRGTQSKEEILAKEKKEKFFEKLLRIFTGAPTILVISPRSLA